ncbi:MAG: FAD-dependent oxidoreductase, partial [Vicinamibacteria bacterium]
RGVLGADGPGILGALEWIRRMKLDPDASVDGIRSAIVVGGGNTALDAVQELAGLGVPEVTLVYRRGVVEMPGYRHEWEGAKKLRVHLVDRAFVHEVRRHPDGSLASVVLERAAAGDNLIEISCDLLLLGTGQERLQELAESFPGVRCDTKGRIVADSETLATGNPRVFTGGDCYNGGKEVVNAAAEGQRAAHAIDRLLTGS